MNELTLVGALLVGLMGSSHCLAMCGGLSTVLGITANKPNYPRLLSYNAGRLLTYTAIGALFGFIGQQAQLALPTVALVLRTVAGLLLIAMGLYISRWWMGLTWVEQLGAMCWRYIHPLTRHLLPVTSHRQAWQLGVLWGLLPCGLVYSTLGWALATGQWQQSALFMLAFGVGTLPAMLSVGAINQQLLHRLKGTLFRTVAGLIVIAMGLVMLIVLWMHGGDHQYLPSTAVDNKQQHHRH